MRDEWRKSTYQADHFFAHPGEPHLAVIRRTDGDRALRRRGASNLAQKLAFLIAINEKLVRTADGIEHWTSLGGKSCITVVEAIDKFLSSVENEQRSNICDETVTLQHLILERASTWSCDGGFAPLVLRTWLHRRSRPSTRTESTNQAPFVASKTFGT